jgi:hypothetical protein
VTFRSTVLLPATVSVRSDPTDGDARLNHLASTIYDNLFIRRSLSLLNLFNDRWVHTCLIIASAIGRRLCVLQSYHIADRSLYILFIQVSYRLSIVSLLTGRYDVITHLVS